MFQQSCDACPAVLVDFFYFYSVGDFQVEADIRACGVLPDVKDAGCQKASSSSNELVTLSQSVLTWVTGLADLEFTGKFCKCKTDKCFAECSDDIYTMKLPFIKRSMW